MTLPSAHSLMVLTTGLIFMSSGAVLAEIGRILGPSYHTKVTVHWAWRALCFLGAGVLFFRGVTYLFPGDLVRTSIMSLVAPAEALVVVGVCLTLLDWVMRDRAPPPYAERILRWMVKTGATQQQIADAALTLPPVTVGEAPASETHRCRINRLTVMALALLAVATVVFIIVLNSTTAQA